VFKQETKRSEARVGPRDEPDHHRLVRLPVRSGRACRSCSPV